MGNDRFVLVTDPDGHGAEVLAAAPGSDSGQKAIAVRIISALGGAGGGGPATIADGGDVAQGAKADVAWVSGDGTVIAILKKIAAGGAGLTDTQLRASAVPVSGPLTDTQLRASAVPVSGTFFQGTQPVSLAAAVDVSDRAARLLGVVDKGKVWDGTNIAAVKAGVIAVAGDNPLVVTVHPSSAPMTTQPVSVAATVTTTESPPTSVTTGKTTVTTAGTRVQLASNAAKSITVKALSINTGTIYVGNSGVASSNGFQLGAGAAVSLDISNSNVVWLDCSVNGEGVSWVVVN